MQIRRQADDRHDLGRDHDVEAVLAREAVAGTAESDGDVAQRPVVHVDHALPGDAAQVEVELIPMINVVVDERREQIVGERDGAKIAGEVQVDILHRHDLRVAAARRSALEAKYRPEAGFAQTDDRILADGIERIAQTDRGRRLALAGGRRAHGRHQDQPAVRPALQAGDKVERNLGFVAAVRVDARGRDADAGRHVANGLHDCFSGDLDV